MKAVCIKAYKHPVVIKDLPIPTIGVDEVLVKIFASGVCHTDVHMVDGDLSSYYPSPKILGHEGAGVIAKVGGNVENIKVGDRVGVAMLGYSCRNCDLCLRQFEPLCPKAKFIGGSLPGCYAEYVAVDHNYVVKLPEGVKFTDVAAFMCAGLTVYRGIKESGVAAGQWLSVSGIGGLGHLAVQFANSMGLRVIAVDIDDDKLALAKQLGAELTVNATKENFVAKIHEKTQGAHGAIVTATSAIAFAQAIDIIRPCGTVVFIGLPPNKGEMPPLPISKLIWGCKTIKGSVVGDRTDLREVLQFTSKVKVHYEVAQMEQINEVLNRLRDGKVLGRVVLQLADEIYICSFVHLFSQLCFKGLRFRFQNQHVIQQYIATDICLY